MGAPCRIDAHAWASLGLLADLWETGMLEDPSCDPCSPTELARGPHSLSYHQVNRRAGLFKTAGLLHEWQGPGRRRCYALTEKTRRTMGLLVGIARWRHHHVVGEEEEGMTAEEMATALKTALPLVRLEGHSGKSMKLCVLREDEPAGEEGEVVWTEVKEDGALHSCTPPAQSADAWARGKVAAWIPAILDDNPEKILIGGGEQLFIDALAKLHDVLWTPEDFEADLLRVPQGDDENEGAEDADQPGAPVDRLPVLHRGSRESG